MALANCSKYGKPVTCVRVATFLVQGEEIKANGRNRPLLRGTYEAFARLYNTVFHLFEWFGDQTALLHS